MSNSLFSRAVRRLVLAAAVLSGFARWARGGPLGRTSAASSGDARAQAAGLSALLWRWGPLAAGAAVAAAVGGFLVSASGMVPIKASSGHWPITQWMLEFSMRRSVGTHAMFIDVPPLEDGALVLRGAGHYEIGCAPCHGSPEVRTPRIARRMTPHPPYLGSTVEHWEPQELFYIVKHGVKFTGMPAWPALGRDDEVWAMVAFLRRLPGLDAHEYRRLSRGEAQSGTEASMHQLLAAEAAPPPTIQACIPCHGRDGRGRAVAAFPSLAGQRRGYLEASLRAFARGERHSGIMEPQATGLSDAEIALIARHYSSQGGSSPARSATEGGVVGRGAEIAERGVPAQRVPPCLSCHGPGPRNPVYPILDGQYGAYLALQLQLFKAGVRGGTPYAHLMQHVARGLTPEQIEDVAAYFASRAP